MEILPLSIDRWGDLEQLFGPRGACGVCWCMWWRLTGAEYDKAKGEGNKATFRAIVQSGTCPGLLAYEGGRAIGWCAVEPREIYAKLGRSRVLKPVDDEPVWSIPCFFVDRAHRGQGVAAALLEGVIDYAQARGARILEGYPVEPRKDTIPDLFAFTGVVDLFNRLVSRKSRGDPRPARSCAGI